MRILSFLSLKKGLKFMMMVVYTAYDDDNDVEYKDFIFFIIFIFEEGQIRLDYDYDR